MISKSEYQAVFKMADYNGSNQGSFYIQSHGHNAGKPLKYPIPNCFTVQSSNPLAFQIAFCLYQARLYEPYIMGSVIPYIRLSDAKKLLSNALKLNFESKKLEVVQLSIDEAARCNELSSTWMKYAQTFARQLYKEAMQV